MILVHFASEQDCSKLAAMFPGETWPLVMMFFSPGKYELDAIEDMQEFKKILRLEKEVLGG